MIAKYDKWFKYCVDIHVGSLWLLQQMKSFAIKVTTFSLTALKLPHSFGPTIHNSSSWLMHGLSSCPTGPAAADVSTCGLPWNDFAFCTHHTFCQIHGTAYVVVLYHSICICQPFLHSRCCTLFFCALCLKTSNSLACIFASFMLLPCESTATQHALTSDIFNALLI